MVSNKKYNKLLQENADLKAQLALANHNNRRSALIEKADLPPCKSLACYTCKHIAYIPGVKSGVYLLGCGKDLDCPEHEQQDESKVCPAELLEELQDYLQTQLLSQFPIL